MAGGTGDGNRCPSVTDPQRVELAIMDALSSLFDTADFPPRWYCGSWTELHGWTHIVADCAVFGAYMAIPAVFCYFLWRRRDVPYSPLIWLFAAFIFFCGFGHLIEATLFWHPWYRFSALVKLCTAIVSWGAVVALVPVVPKLLKLPRLATVNAQLAREVSLRRENEARFRSTIAEAVTAMLLVDEQGRIKLANDEAGRVFGYHSDELVGQSVEILVPERFRNGHPSLRAGFLRNPQARRMGAGRELFGVRQDGTEIAVEVGLSPITMEDGMNVLGTVIDISERKRLQDAQLELQQLLAKAAQARAERLSRTNDELEQANSQLKQFASVASHDLQEPLRKMGSFCELLSQKYHGRLDADADRYINYIIDGANRMRALINDLLQLSRIGSQAMKFEPTDLNYVVDCAVDNLAVSVRESGAVVTRDALPTIPAHAEQLTQLFQNLIGNAIKFQRPGVPPAVHVAVRPDGTDWILSVRDNGIGIEAQYHDKIFAIFQRLHAQSEYAGTGIGLAICAKIVERHGGRISVESEIGSGSVFSVRIPQQGAPGHERDSGQAASAAH
jgi:PAS domain S-box-containing protein